MRKNIIISFLLAAVLSILACQAAGNSTPVPVSIVVSTLTPPPTQLPIPATEMSSEKLGIDCSTVEATNDAIKFAVNVAEQNVGFTADRFAVKQVTPDCKEALIEITDEVSLYNWGNVYLPVFQSLFGKDTLIWYVIQDGETGFIVKANWLDGDDKLQAIVLADTLPRAIEIFSQYHTRPQ